MAVGTGQRRGLTYQCPHCQARLGVHAELAGDWVRCPACGRAGRAPELTPPVVEPPRDGLIFLDDPPRAPSRAWRVFGKVGLTIAVAAALHAAIVGNADYLPAWLTLAAICLVPMFRHRRA